MLTLEQYLIESTAYDRNIHSKRFDKNNRVLFNTVGSAIKDYFGRTISFAPLENKPENRYVRTTIYHNDYDQEFSRIIMTTDLAKNTVSIVYRGPTSRFMAKFIDQAVKLIDRQLKRVCKAVDKTDINTGRQYGASWKLTEFDASTKTRTVGFSNPVRAVESDSKRAKRDETYSGSTAIERMQKTYDRYKSRIKSAKSVMATSKLWNKLQAVFDKFDCKVTDRQKFEWAVTTTSSDRPRLTVHLKVYFKMNGESMFLTFSRFRHCDNQRHVEELYNKSTIGNAELNSGITGYTNYEKKGVVLYKLNGNKWEPVRYEHQKLIDAFGKLILSSKIKDVGELQFV